MLSDRIREQIDWPGRLARGEAARGDSGAAGEEESGADSGAPVGTMIDPSRREELARQFEEAERELQAMEEAALEEIRRELGGDVSGRPTTEEAVRYVAGTHPDFSEVGGVPGEEKLEDERITAESFRRSYDILEHADRNAYRIDIKRQVATPEEDEVRRYDEITTPAEAAGRRDPGRAETNPDLPAAFEKSSRERQAGLGKKAFWLIGSFLFKALGKGVRKIARSIEDALSIGIGPYSLSLGKFIAKPLHFLADWLMDLAERLMEKAFGYDPADRDPPERPRGQEEGDLPGGDVDRSQLPGAEDPTFEDIIGSEPDAGPDTPGLGMRMLQAGKQVVEATADEAQRADDSGLRRAVERYDKARVLQRDLEAHKEIGAAWGVPIGDADSSGESAAQAGTDTAAAVEEEGPIDKC